MRPAELDLARYRVRLDSETDFAGWRDAARRLALNEVRPEDVDWHVAPGSEQAQLPEVPAGAQLVVPRDFLGHAETAFCHSDPGRFAFLYRMLWRLRDEAKLLEIASDSDTRRLEAMEKAVRRDSHKMHAFVRFRKIGDGADERYVAWFEPDHFIVERNADFFVRRFTGMRWTILTLMPLPTGMAKGWRSGRARPRAMRLIRTIPRRSGAPISRTSSTRRD